MKWNKLLLTSILAAVLTLTACNNDNETGQRDGNDNMNTRPVRYDYRNDEPGIDRFSQPTPRDSSIRSDEINQKAREGRTPAEINYPPMNTQRHPDTRMDTGNRDVDRNNVQKNNDKNNDINYKVADEAANRIKRDITEVNNVYVLTTDNNAYVAATWDKESELTDEIKQKITQTVKSVESDIDNVYITTNPDFFDLTDRYMNDIDDKPVQGFFDQVSNMINRIFPSQELTEQ